MDFNLLTPDQVQRLTGAMNSPLTWAETFILLPRSNFAGELFKANFVQKTLLSTTKRKIIVCVHRRAGKTYGIIMRMLYYALTRSNFEIIVGAPEGPQVEKIFEDIDAILDANLHIREDVVQSKNQPFIRKFKSGSRIRGFIVTDGADSLRGQSADLILLDEADFIAEKDWQVLDPIIKGDLYRDPPMLIAASTPNINPDSRFMGMLRAGQDLLKPDSDIESLFVPLPDNPDYTPEYVEETRQSYLTPTNRMAQYRREYLCEPGSPNDVFVFPSEHIEQAMRLEKWDPSSTEGYWEKWEGVPQKRPGEVRALCVDWDRSQAGTSLLLLSMEEGLEGYRVLWRHEIDKKTKFLFVYSCEFLVKAFQTNPFDYLVLEATRDVPQAQDIQVRALKEAPDLFSRIETLDYNSNHVSIDLKTKKEVKRRMKNVLVGNLQTLFENGEVFFPKADRTLKDQLTGYKVMGQSERGDRYSKTNEHFIDCLAMGCWVLQRHRKKPKPLARPITHVKVPEPEINQKIKRVLAPGAGTRTGHLLGWKSGSYRKTF